jgi:hypothetical protein
MQFHEEGPDSPANLSTIWRKARPFERFVALAGDFRLTLENTRSGPTGSHWYHGAWRVSVEAENRFFPLGSPQWGDTGHSAGGELIGLSLSD